MHEPFSLLVPVYDGDRPDHIRRAMRSAVDDQTVRPDQVVIVRDGPVRDELARCLDELQRATPVPVTRSQNASCAGPPRALRRTALMGRRIDAIGSRLSNPLERSEATARFESAANPRPAATAARTYSGCPRFRLSTWS